MSADKQSLKDIDPAILKEKEKSKTGQPPPPPAPKIEIPVLSSIVASETTDEALSKVTTDHSKFALVATVDNKIVAVPRAVAGKMPVVAPILADQPLEDHTPIPVDTTATATIAVAHWIEHVGSAAGKAETTLPDVCLFTEMSSFLKTEWEKDFDTKLLVAEPDTLLRATNFAEANGMAGLLEFCIIALSCAIRGKSNQEILAHLDCAGDELTEEELAAGRNAYPWIKDLVKPHGE